VFGLLGVHAVVLVHAPADLAADDAADHHARHGGEHVARALADLVAEDASSDRADDQSGVGVVRTVGSASRDHWNDGDGGNARSAHEFYPPTERIAAALRQRSITRTQCSGLANECAALKAESRP